MMTDPLAAHSLAEAFLYIRATPCAACGQGPLVGRETGAPPQEPSPPHASIMATCRACRATQTFNFRMPETAPPDDSHAETPALNDSDEPSRLLDVGQWITLFRVLAESAGKEVDKARARALKLQSAQCLEEALKFYDDPDNDLPPVEAFFVEPSRERFRKAPDQFSRRRLTELRASLPNPVRSASDDASKKNHWWQRG